MTDTKQRSDLADLSAAYRTRDAIAKIAQDVVYSEYPRPRYAVVQSVDTSNRVAMVRYTDEEVDFPVTAGSMCPVGAGAVVRLAGPTGARYIDDVISGNVSINGVDTLTAWTAVSFASGWANLGSGYQAMQYRKEGDKVCLRGYAEKLSATSGSETILTLPVGFRPPATLLDGVWSFVTGASPAQATRAVVFQTDGRITIGGIALTGSSNWLCLNYSFSTLA